jgi:predicted nuclease with TOPRIM domain
VSREELIARKGEVQAQIAQARRRLEQARQEAEGTSGLRRRWLSARVAQLETRLDSLMTEEGRLRQLIDRTRP